MNGKKPLESSTIATLKLDDSEVEASLLLVSSSNNILLES